MKKLIIIGAGGFGKSIIDSIEDKSIIFGFVDTFKTNTHYGYPIISDCFTKVKNYKDFDYFIAIGEPLQRKIFFDLLISNNCNLTTIVDSTAIVSKNATIGKGVYIGKQVVVNADAIIEDNVVLNTRALIEHGNIIEKHTNISTNVVLNGDVKVGERTFIGSSSVSNGQITIGSNCIVGSGSVIIRNIDDNLVVAGCPTRIIRRNENE